MGKATREAYGTALVKVGATHKDVVVLDADLSKSTKTDEFKKVKPALEEIAELRQLERFGPAKQRWRFLLENLFGNDKKEKQMALSQYANQQNWFDLGVDGSIIAKAFDYIQLRLPIAYSHYYDIALKSRPALSKTKPQAALNTNVSKSFAMAISRQESAWNPQAQSSANARGLMQLLPTTAKADEKQLPATGSQDSAGLVAAGLMATLAAYGLTKRKED